MTAWKVEVWNLPHNDPHEVVIGHVPAVDVSWRDGLDMIGSGVLTLPANYPLLNTICDPDPGQKVSTLIRVYVNQSLAFSFFADDRGDPYVEAGGDRVVDIFGDGIQSCLEWGKVYPWDWPDYPTVNADWIYGSEEVAGSFSAGDMEGLGQNQISNGGFESGSFSPWHRSGTHGDEAKRPSLVQVVSDQFSEGAFSCKVNPVERGSGISQKDLRVTVGKTYQIQCAIKGNTGDRYRVRVTSPNTNLGIDTLGGGAPNVYQNDDRIYAEIDNAAEGTGSADGTWQDTNMGVVIVDYTNEADEDEGNDGLLKIKVEYAGPDNGGVMHVDDLRMVEVNGGFAPWLPKGDATLSADVNTPHTGLQCLQVDANGDSGTGNRAGVKQLVVGLTPRRRHTFSAWVRNQESTTKDLTIRLREQFGSVRGAETYALEPFTWTHISCDGRLKDPSVLCELIIGGGETYPFTFRVDDAILSPGGPPQTPGVIVRQLLNDAQSRGALEWLQHSSFDDETDSDAVDWEERISLTVQRGAGLADVARALLDQGYESRVAWHPGTEDWHWELYNEGGTGTDRSADAFPAFVYGGQGVVDSVRHRGVPRGNVVLSEGSEGVVVEVEDEDYVEAYDRREVYTGDDALRTLASVTRRANKALRQVKKKETSHRLLVSSEAGNFPLPAVNFDLGDLIPVRWAGGVNPQQLRVVGWSIQSDGEEIHADLQLGRWRPQPTEVVQLAVNALMSEKKKMADPQLFLAAGALEEPGEVPAGGGMFPVVLLVAENAPQIWLDAAVDNAYAVQCGAGPHDADFLAAEEMAGAASYDFVYRQIWVSPGLFELSTGAVLHGNYTFAPLYPLGDFGDSINSEYSLIQVLDLAGSTGNVLELEGFYRNLTVGIDVNETVTIDAIVYAEKAYVEDSVFWLTVNPADTVTLDYGIVLAEYRDVKIGYADNDTQTAEGIVHLIGPSFTTGNNARATRGLRIALDDNTEVLPTCVVLRNTHNTMMLDTAIFAPLAESFATGHMPVRMIFDDGTGQALISDFMLDVGSGFNWTGVDAIVNIDEEMLVTAGFFNANISSFSIGKGGSAITHPPIIGNTLTLGTSTNVTSTRVMAGITADRPTALLSRGMLYVNTDSTPVLQYSTGAAWVNL